MIVLDLLLISNIYHRGWNLLDQGAMNLRSQSSWVSEGPNHSTKFLCLLSLGSSATEWNPWSHYCWVIVINEDCSPLAISTWSEGCQDSFKTEGQHRRRGWTSQWLIWGLFHLLFLPPGSLPLPCYKLRTCRRVNAVVVYKCPTTNLTQLSCHSESLWLPTWVSRVFASLG